MAERAKSEPSVSDGRFKLEFLRIRRGKFSLQYFLRQKILSPSYPGLLQKCLSLNITPSAEKSIKERQHYFPNAASLIETISSIGISVPSSMTRSLSETEMFRTTPVTGTYAPPAFRSSGTKWRSGAIPAASASYHVHCFN